MNSGVGLPQRWTGNGCGSWGARWGQHRHWLQSRLRVEILHSVSAEESGWSTVEGDLSYCRRGNSVDYLIKQNNLEHLPSQNTSCKNKVSPLLPTCSSPFKTQLLLLLKFTYILVKMEEKSH